MPRIVYILEYTLPSPSIICIGMIQPQGLVSTFWRTDNGHLSGDTVVVFIVGNFSWRPTSMNQCKLLHCVVGKRLRKLE